MDYEKKYKEALERAKGMMALPTDKATIEFIFPELAESEDERVRKELMAVVDDLILPDDQKARFNTWLEKQKEKSMLATEVLARAGLKPYKDGNQWCILAGDNIQEGICGFGNTIDEALYQFLMEVLEKQKEQTSSIPWVKSDNVTNPDKPYIDKAGWFYTTDGRMCPASEIEKQKEEEGYEAIPVESTLEYKLGFKAGKESEKQKEQKPIPLMNGDADLYYDSWIQERPGSPTKRECFYEGISYAQRLQKEQEPEEHVPENGETGTRKEQKPVEKLSKEDCVKKFKVLCDAYEIKLPNREYDIYGLCEDLYKLFGDIQKPAEWSEEDKAMLKVAIAVLRRYSHDDVANWLKSLPERFNLQPKQEWSEEDETAFGDLMWCIKQAAKSAKDENDMGNIWFAENWVKNRLKSLRPHWKPSEGQLEALKAAMEHKVCYCGCNHGALKSLYNDLKKL